MYRKYIERLPFFQEKNGHFIAFVCPMLVQQFVSQDEIIYREGDPVNEVYFLLEGKVGMVLSPLAKQHVFMYIEEGHYFGEIDLLSQTALDETSTTKKTAKDKKRKFTTVTMSNCSLLLWSKKNLYLADKEFDDVIRSIFLTAKKRLSKATHAKKQAREYYDDIIRKFEGSKFKPIVTSAGKQTNNIFHGRKQNLNNDSNDTILEENEGEDLGNKTFERMNPEFGLYDESMIENSANSPMKDASGKSSGMNQHIPEKEFGMSMNFATPLKKVQSEVVSKDEAHTPLVNVPFNKNRSKREPESTIRRKQSSKVFKNFENENQENWVSHPKI